MSTESEHRTHASAINRLAYALVDILTGVVEARVERSYPPPARQPAWTLKVKGVEIQDD